MTTSGAANHGAVGFFHPRRLGHANLFVSDYERAYEFYHDVVGFHEVYRQPDNQASFVSNGNTYHDLGLTDIRSRYAAKDQAPGLWHLAFEMENEVELVDAYRRAIDAGVAFAFTMDHDVAHSIYKYDPDGDLVEVYADIEKDWRALRHGIIIKEKPKWVPGVTSAPLEQRNYPVDPEIEIVKEAIFHPKRVTHVAFVAADFAAMYRYYTEIIGLSPLVGDQNSPFAVLRGTFGTGDVTLHRPRDGHPPGMHHVGFAVWDEADLDRSLAALRAAGMQAEREIDHPARRSLCIRDPDGIRLQFHVDRRWTPEIIATATAESALYLL